MSVKEVSRLVTDNILRPKHGYAAALNIKTAVSFFRRLNNRLFFCADRIYPHTVRYHIT